jgi:hypothetical protein
VRLYAIKRRKETNNKKNQRRHRVRTVYLCSPAQVAGQKAVEALAVSMCLKASDCRINMPQEQLQARLYSCLAVELVYKNYETKNATASNQA